MLFDEDPHMNYSVCLSKPPLLLQRLSKTNLKGKCLKQSSLWCFFVSWNFILNYLRKRHETQHPNILGHLGRLDCLFLVATRAYGFSCNSLLRLNWILLWCGFCTNLLYHHIYVCRYKCNFQL